MPHRARQVCTRVATPRTSHGKNALPGLADGARVGWGQPNAGEPTGHRTGRPVADSVLGTAAAGTPPARFSPLTLLVRVRIRVESDLEPRDTPSGTVVAAR